MKSPSTIFLEKAQSNPQVLSIINRSLGIQETQRLGILEEGKKVLNEDGEQSGSSAIDSSSLGDYKVYGRGWVRPAKRPEAKDQLPEEKEKDPDIELYKEEDEGKEWCWENDEFIEKVATKVADILADLADDEDEDDADIGELDDDLFYDPDDEIEDTPYSMDGLDEEADIDKLEMDEEKEEPLTMEEHAEYIAWEVAQFSSFTLMQEETTDAFAIALDKELCSVIEEDLKKPLNKGEMIRRKLVARRRMKRMASKMKARRKVKFRRSDLKTVKSRVHKAAIKVLKNKFAKSKGGKYDDLSLSAKVDVDTMVKKRANLIPNIERKLFSKYRAKLAQRRKAKTVKPKG